MWRMRALPFKKWPEHDRALFTAGLKNSSRRLRGGAMSKKADATKDGWRHDYGIALNWLQQNNHLTEVSDPASLWPQRILERYVEYMVSLEFAAVTIHTRIGRLKRALQVMTPGIRLKHFEDIRRELDPPKPRFDPIVLLVDSQQLKQLGIDLMETARRRTDLDAKDRADQFRSGLQIALIACRPWRRRTFTLMILWKHLRKIDEAWRMEAAPEDTKNRRGLRTWVPKDLNPYVNEYVTFDRNTLCKGAKESTDALWVTRKGMQQTKEQFYREYCRYTRERFGRHVTLQATRKIVATTVAINSPENARIAQTILGQSGPEVGEQYYNFATSIAALSDLSKVMDGLAKNRRKKGKGKK